MAEGLEPGPDARGGTAHTLRHGAHPAVVTREDSDDPVGLAQLLGAQHDSFVPVQAHEPILVGSRHLVGRGTPVADADPGNVSQEEES